MMQRFSILLLKSPLATTLSTTLINIQAAQPSRTSSTQGISLLSWLLGSVRAHAKSLQQSIQLSRWNSWINFRSRSCLKDSVSKVSSGRPSLSEAPAVDLRLSVYLRSRSKKKRLFTQHLALSSWMMRPCSKDVAF